MTFIWGDKPRTILDPTKIDEAIDEAIDAHNDDPDSHLDDGQALKSHRAAEVIDHAAESIFNDKLAAQVRSHTALVGTGALSDYDTIQGAIDYCVGVGGGSILVYPGDHYLSGKVDLPANVSLFGTDNLTCKIHGEFSNGDYLNFTDFTSGQKPKQIIKNLAFINDGGGVFYQSSEPSNHYQTTSFLDCTFSGGGLYVAAIFRTVYFKDCYFTFDKTAPLRINQYLYLTNCIFDRIGTTGTSYILLENPVIDELYQIYIDNCDFNLDGKTGFKLLDDSYLEIGTIKNSYFTNIDPTDWGFYFYEFTNNYLNLDSNKKIVFDAYGPESIYFTGNRILGGATKNLTINGTNHFVTNNILKGTPTDNGTNTFLSGNQIL